MTKQHNEPVYNMSVITRRHHVPEIPLSEITLAVCDVYGIPLYAFKSDSCANEYPDALGMCFILACMKTNKKLKELAKHFGSMGYSKMISCKSRMKRLLNKGDEKCFEKLHQVISKIG